MKAFVAAVSVLALLALGVALNCVCVSRIVSATQAELGALPVPEPGAEDYTDEIEAVCTFRQKWSKHERFVSLTLNHEDLMQLSSGLATLEGAARAGDRLTYITTLTTVVEALDHLRKLTAFSLDAVF